ncbi:MAG: methylmalonyl Co-A mutase-associated GTPase MeaB [Geminicoccaceae bacterium]
MTSAVLDLTGEALAARILQGDRVALARAITLVESRRADHQQAAQDLLQRLLPATGRALRVGITGVPGVGKSTFIEALGCNLRADGQKVAVLAVDPTSQRSGGSILGDKTRMARLSADDGAFIRPSPSAGTLGGVARKTHETMLLCEAAGFDVVLIETVGVGQSETMVAEMVDFFLVLMLPGAGDDLQGIKKGILELADMIAVNKADERDDDLRAKAAARHYRTALDIIQPQTPSWRPPVILCSGLHNWNLDALWRHVVEHRAKLSETGEFADKRRKQQVRWMWRLLEDRLMRELRSHPAVSRRLGALEAEVAAGSVTAGLAVDELIALFKSA